MIYKELAFVNGAARVYVGYRLCPSSIMKVYPCHNSHWNSVVSFELLIILQCENSVKLANSVVCAWRFTYTVELYRQTGACMLHKCAGLPFESTEKYNFDIFAQFTCAVLLYRQTQNMCKLGGDCRRRHRQGLLHACILYSAQTSLTSVANCTGEPIRYTLLCICSTVHWEKHATI